MFVYKRWKEMVGHGCLLRYGDNLANMALPALDSFDRPSSFDIHAPVLLISSRSTPVVAPRLCKQWTRSSVATFPVAPFE